jgi:hypothetical protein
VFWGIFDEPYGASGFIELLPPNASIPEKGAELQVCSSAIFTAQKFLTFLTGRGLVGFCNTCSLYRLDSV